MGPMSIRVATYFPFNVTCYFNGHSFVAQELRRDGVRFRKADNAFLAVSDVAALQAAADRFDGCAVAAPLQLLGAPSGPGLQSRRTCGAATWVPIQHGPDGAGDGRRLQTLRTTQSIIPDPAATTGRGSSSTRD